MSASVTPPVSSAALVARARADLVAGDPLGAQTAALVAIAAALTQEPEPIDAATLTPRIKFDRPDDDTTLDDFHVQSPQLVHFEATDNSAWYATIVLANGDMWQLHFGAQDCEAPGYARAEQIT